MPTAPARRRCWNTILGLVAPERGNGAARPEVSSPARSFRPATSSGSAAAPDIWTLPVAGVPGSHRSRRRARRVRCSQVRARRRRRASTTGDPVAWRANVSVAGRADGPRGQPARARRADQPPRPPGDRTAGGRPGRVVETILLVTHDRAPLLDERSLSPVTIELAAYGHDRLRGSGGHLVVTPLRYPGKHRRSSGARRRSRRPCGHGSPRRSLRRPSPRSRAGRRSRPVTTR